MSSTLFSGLGLILQLFLRLTVASGFLDAGCQTQTDPWYLEDGVAMTTCDTHICDGNVQTALNLNLCIGTHNGFLIPQAR